MAKKVVRMAEQAKRTETGSLYTGENLSVTLEDDGMVHIVFDPNGRLGRSASGKTIRVCSTEGNKPLVLNGKSYGTIGLNVYVKE